MTPPRRLLMVADLESVPTSAPLHDALPAPRPVTLGDAAALGRLAHQAFKGGVDDQGETVEEYVVDLRRTIAGEFGDLMVDASAALATADDILAATVITWERGAPFMPYCLTAPRHQGQGLGTHLIVRAARALREQGHRQLVLAVVEGNPAERLYRRLGFREAPIADGSAAGQGSAG